jgi:hypothetical protein
MSNSTTPYETQTQTELYTGLISTGFTILSFLVYKLVKKYTVKSSCINNELHISLTNLDDKISQTHSYITAFFEAMTEEVQKQDKYNKLLREHRDTQLQSLQETSMKIDDTKV